MKTIKLLFTVTLAIFLFMYVPGVDRPLVKPTPYLPDYKPLQKEIFVYLKKQPGTYGLYFIDLNSGRELGYNALTPFHAASTFKLPMNIYLYREAVEGRLDMEEELTFADRHLEGGTGILKEHQPGSRYTIARLAELSIVHSDNIATNILLERLDRQKVKNFMRSLGARVVDDNTNITCPYDLALYMREMLNFSRTRAGDATTLLSHLFNSRHKDRIAAPLPEGTRVANKIGTWPLDHTYNDAAYVVHPERPYILVITSRDTPGYGESLPVIHFLSKMVYDYQTGIDSKERE